MKRFTLLLLCACATSAPIATSSVPANLAAPGTTAERLVTSAKGTQNYTCKENAGKFEWAFTAPEADLFDASGNKLGTHFAGPTWQLDDGSKVVAAVKEKAPAPGSIAWLLLEVKSSEGQGKLTGVTYIQRLDTAGGNPPADGCDGAHAGEVRKVPYTASYHFFAAR
ncbi:MAG TPA: DUF3455 domain-containing protein [Myxococcales bacterium]|nr:DUF3455 domain-containing protein [Myxococcales bacterium]